MDKHVIKKVLVTKKDDVKAAHVGFHPAYEFDKRDVLPRDGGNQCAVTFYDIAPGKSNYPFHYHTASEEIFYIIAGEGVVETNEGAIPISAGSVVVCPVGEEGAHRITTPSGSEPLTYINIDVVPTVDMAVYPKTGKIGVFTRDGFTKWYKTDGNVPYYEGE